MPLLSDARGASLLLLHLVMLRRRPDRRMASMRCSAASRPVPPSLAHNRCVWLPVESLGLCWRHLEPRQHAGAVLRRCSVQPQKAPLLRLILGALATATLPMRWPPLLDRCPLPQAHAATGACAGLVPAW